MTKSEKRAYHKGWYRRHKATKNMKRELFGARFDMSWWRPLHRSRAK